jgi:hypothetical protein
VLPEVDPPRYLGGYERKVQANTSKKTDVSWGHEPCSGVFVSAVECWMRATVTDRRYRARFKDRENLQGLDAHRCHEPMEIPLNRPSGTFSPTGGEGWDEGVRFMERVTAAFTT